MNSAIHTRTFTAIVDDFVAAYNAKDFARCRAQLAPKFYFQHHNRGVEHHDPDEFIETLRLFASEYLPDRRFGAPTAVVEAGNVVVRQQPWGGTATVDLPGIAAAGEKVALDLCSVFTIEDQLITQYHDYG